jgi:hypothetical protein
MTERVDPSSKLKHWLLDGAGEPTFIYKDSENSTSYNHGNLWFHRQRERERTLSNK